VLSRTETRRTRRTSTARAQEEAPSWRLPRGASLGPATVVEPDAGGQPLRVLLSSGEIVEALWALPFRYLAQAGDTLLVIERGERHYVLSVIHGRGRTQLALSGEGLLRAAGGKLRLRGERGVKLTGPRVTLRGQTLGLVARVVHEKLGEVTQRIAKRVFERAGRSRRVIEGDDWHSAGERTVVAADSALFNGDLIRIS